MGLSPSQSTFQSSGAKIAGGPVTVDDVLDVAHAVEAGAIEGLTVAGKDGAGKYGVGIGAVVSQDDSGGELGGWDVRGSGELEGNSVRPFPRISSAKKVAQAVAAGDRSEPGPGQRHRSWQLRQFLVKFAGDGSWLGKIRAGMKDQHGPARRKDGQGGKNDLFAGDGDPHFGGVDAAFGRRTENSLIWAGP